VSGIRLLCRAHNQHAAEQTFGTEFMRHKRIAAAEARAAAKAPGAAAHATPAEALAVPKARAAAAHSQAAAAERAPVRSRADAQDRDVVPWLRALGFNAAEARRAAARCEDMPEASLEERVRVALTCFRVGGTRLVQPPLVSSSASAATPLATSP
jgi:hypothetical protein